MEQGALLAGAGRMRTILADVLPILGSHDEGLEVIFLSKGCFNKALQTGWLINNSNLFCTVPEVGGLRSGCSTVR